MLSMEFSEKSVALCVSGIFGPLKDSFNEETFVVSSLIISSMDDGLAATLLVLFNSVYSSSSLEVRESTGTHIGTVKPHDPKGCLSRNTHRLANGTDVVLLLEGVDDDDEAEECLVVRFDTFAFRGRLPCFLPTPFENEVAAGRDDDAEAALPTERRLDDMTLARSENDMVPT
jgi:hypothetical protein